VSQEAGQVRRNPAKGFSNVARKGSTDGRPSVPAEMLSVFQMDEGPLQGICVPLMWKREIHLPPERSLEAWYFLADNDEDDSWRIDPRQIAAARQSHLHSAQFIFKASLEPEDGKRRLAAAGLVTDLQKRSGGTVWFLQESRSIPSGRMRRFRSGTTSSL
jgi:hypothetical protein